MDRIRSMEVFVAVAREGSFAAAARTLEISTSVATRAVQDLEGWLGVQLLNRTTRQVDLTDAGSAYLERCAVIVDETLSLARAAQERQETPQGEIKVTAPLFLGRYFLRQVVPDFVAANPAVRLRLHLMDRLVDLVAEGFDLAVRVGVLRDSALIARRLGTMQLQLAASPGYLDLHGRPDRVDELRHHACIVDLVTEHGTRWPLVGEGGAMRMAVQGSISVNDGEMARDMAVAGLGITLLPDFFIADEVAAGTLETVLPTSWPPPAGIHILYPPARHLSSAVRAFVDALAAKADLVTSRG